MTNHLCFSAAVSVIKAEETSGHSEFKHRAGRHRFDPCRPLKRPWWQATLPSQSTRLSGPLASLDSFTALPTHWHVDPADGSVRPTAVGCVVPNSCEPEVRWRLDGAPALILLSNKSALKSAAAAAASSGLLEEMHCQEIRLEFWEVRTDETCRFWWSVSSEADETGRRAGRIRLAGQSPVSEDGLVNVFFPFDDAGLISSPV